MIKIGDNYYQTPCYIYDIKQLIQNVNAFRSLLGEDITILYATMANPRIEILKELNNLDIGTFVNSIEHLKNSLKANIPEKKINFAGSGHSKALIDEISDLNISYCADSLSQLKLINSDSNLDLGIRINVGTLLMNGFDPAPRLGINIEDISKAIEINNKISILHVYLGTNLEESDIYKKAIISLLDLAKKYPNINTIDLGGGLAFSPNDKNFAKRILLEIKQIWDNNKHSNISLIVEPGRALVRSAAKFYVKVEDVKINNGKQYIVVNSSGTWYPRKIIHDANDHFVSIIGRKDFANTQPSVIVGSTTFSKDFLAELKFPIVEIGDVIEFKYAGAYCEAMHLDFLGIDKPNIYFLNQS
ncbi:MAG: hypothetical protein K9I71_06480 [Ignavibacteriales bacterium]|nr:hypothetical protein [Ignavibacteriales bacterium]MCF8315749.1 hypothetical protein [Ignavibacteriales bacterium]MCF8437057.1 hypothetical protein [Ignavibacteriales bacterium]